MTKQQKAELVAVAEQTKAAYEAAKAARDLNRNADTLQATVDTWNAMSAAHIAAYGKQKTGGYASRAGQRQAAERNAQVAANRQAAWGRYRGGVR
jgi:hypothetical protein